MAPPVIVVGRTLTSNSLFSRGEWKQDVLRRIILVYPEHGQIQNAEVVRLGGRFLLNESAEGADLRVFLRSGLNFWSPFAGEWAA
jgi:hypothetical protein